MTPERTAVVFYIAALIFNGWMCWRAVLDRLPPHLVVVFGALACVALDGLLTIINSLPA